MKRRDIVRSKTGCFTCRRRRKKCDERKPGCWNCERNRLQCEGYQTTRRWEPTSEEPKVQGQSSNRTTIPGRIPFSPMSNAGDNHSQGQTPSSSRSQSPDQTIPPDPLGFTDSDTFDNPRASVERRATRQHPLPSSTTIDWVGNSALESTSRLRSSDHVSAGFSHAGRYKPRAEAKTPEHNAAAPVDLFNASSHDREKRKRQPHSQLPSVSLPSIVEGVDSAIDKRLLHHFTQTVSRILVMVADAAINPFTQLNVPLALQDRGEWGLLDLILSLSASHLGRLLKGDGSPHTADDLAAVERAKWKHYSRAVTQHAKRLSSLMNSTTPGGGNDFREDQQIDYAMATTMLLCQWSTCEGGGESNWRIHLSANRDLVRRKFDRPPNAQLVCLGATSQTLLEWFYYHDAIATLTLPQQSCCIDLNTGVVEAFGMSAAATTIAAQFSSKPIQQVMWVGVNDGLLALICRTLSLRRSNPLANSQPDRCDVLSNNSANRSDSPVHSMYGTESQHAELTTSQLLEALSIESALEEWSYEYETPQQSLVGECYRLAAFLLLFYTVNPFSSSSNAKIHNCLDQFTSLLAELSPTDNAITCSLLPLFICGVSATNNTTRCVVRSKIRDYQIWTGFGHVSDVVDFLQEWWEEQDSIPSPTTSSAVSFAHPCSPDARSEQFRDGQLHTERRSWWAWQDFMTSRNRKLILI